MDHELRIAAFNWLQEQVSIHGDVLPRELLEHGLKELHQTKIILPISKNLWPDRDFLDWRYQKFKRAI
jgi:hypothetical protein